MKLSSLYTYIALTVFASVQGLVNPILPGWNPDPSILRVGKDYFIATSTFEHYPGIPIYHSRDLVGWKLIGHALNRPSQLTLYGTAPHAGVWAPALRYHKGVYYMVGTQRNVYTPELRLFPRSYFVTTRDIFSNKWSEPIYFDNLGYDPDLFWDTNGDVYQTWCGINNPVDKIYGIWQNKIDISTGDALTEANLIFNGTLPLTAAARPEGPHLYHINGTYYLVIAEGGTDVNHRVTVQRGPTPSGPWESDPANPILYNGADLSQPVQSTGHADIVQGPDGQWWGVALGTRPQGGNFSYQQLGREAYLFPARWENGWLIFNDGKPLTEHIPGVLQDRKPDSFSFFDNFSSKSLDLSYYFIRTPQKTFYALNKGRLVIKANSYTVGDRDSPAAILRRQSAYSSIFETQLSFKPTSDKTEAGVTLFMDDYLHNELAIRGAGQGKRQVILRTAVQRAQEGPWPVVPTNNTIVTIKDYPLETISDLVKLRIVARPKEYEFFFAEGGKEFTSAGILDAKAVGTAALGSSFFKGVGFGLYNTGNGFPNLNKAEFVYFNETVLA